MANNVVGTSLAVCSRDPLTGFFRDGCCHTTGDDAGMHSVCAVMTDEFLAFSQREGNDLSTPRREYGFPGLQPGDRWCVCLARWVQALEASCAPPVVLEATHASAAEFIDLEVLKVHAIDVDGEEGRPPATGGSSDPPA